MTVINSFQGEYFFLSNFFYSPFEFDGEIYSTVEHAFQAAKTLELEQHQSIRLAASPAQAKHLGRAVPLRPDWEQVKFDIMLALLKQKFTQTDLRQKLLNTGDSELIEGNTWGDKVWGCVLYKGQWIGQNHLGKLLMKVRADIRQQSLDEVRP
jgi:ribA/ribD-fused uncharacterized protein